MEKGANILTVQFNPDPTYLFDYLTADVQTAECIFDLIDNSIDAARSVMPAGDDKGFPKNYQGFAIKLELSGEAVIIEDNCSGISEQNFVETAFRSGMKSAHKFGIGHFGVGLKRAILKLGRRCVVETDDGKAALRLEFTRDQLDSAGDLQLPATKSSSSGIRSTKILVNEIAPDTKRDLISTRWNETLIHDIRRRYGLFIRKGLVIEVNGQPVKSFAPQPVENQYIDLQQEKFMSHGVEVEIVAGVHEEYRFGLTAKGKIGAAPDNLAIHKKIAAEFGWYIVCNDRVIILHDQSSKTGWTTNWHNEYSGFVGWVHFRSEDPSLLPWNTRKTDIFDNHEVYAEVLVHLQNMAQNYRKATPLASHRRKDNSTSSQPKQSAASQSKQNAATTAKAGRGGAATKSQLSDIQTLLPHVASFKSKAPKLAGLVSEAERLVINDFPYASAMLLRATFDAACRDFLIRHGHYVTMRDAIIDASLTEGKAATAKERKNFSPSLTEMVLWCLNNSEVFPNDNARACKFSFQKFKHHLPTLNGITHETAGISSSGEIRIIRDSVLQGLLHLLEA